VLIFYSEIHIAGPLSVFSRDSVQWWTFYILRIHTESPSYQTYSWLKGQSNYNCIV